MSSYRDTRLTQIELPQNIPSELPYIIDDYTLALHLGVRCKTVWYCVIEKQRLYRRFTIRKSSGKPRYLHAPATVLKYVQKQVDKVLLKPLPVLDCVGAYVPGRSCRYSAERHAGHAVRVGMDLKDFFPTHTKRRVREFFMQRCGYSRYVAGLLADLCTAVEEVPTRAEGPYEARQRKRHFVPQGSPASPTLCNLIAQGALDEPILWNIEAGHPGWVYTRYSDDMTFSHPEKKSRKEVNDFIDMVRECIKNAGYRTNVRKTKVQRSTWRQSMLGMVVNEHPNIPRHVYDRYKAVLHGCTHDGFEAAALRYGKGFEEDPGGFAHHLRGKVSYFVSVNPQRAKKLETLLALAVAADRREKGEAAFDEKIDGEFPDPSTSGHLVPGG